jgi:ABC-type multidrug transport system ATPase subunit
MDDAPVLVEVRELRRAFGGKLVLDGLDLTVRRGERVALLGPNGSGKSTTLRCVAGTLRPSSGTIEVAGHPAGSIEARRIVGVSLSQERSFYLRLSGRQNLRFFARLRGLGSAGAERAIDDISRELEMGGFIDGIAATYSTGMVLRLAFARALLGEPALLLLDEPTRSLDEQAVALLWSAVDRRPHTSVLIATHNEHDVARCSASIRLG